MAAWGVGVGAGAVGFARMCVPVPEVVVMMVMYFVVHAALRAASTCAALGHWVYC